MATQAKALTSKSFGSMLVSADAALSVGEKVSALMRQGKSYREIAHTPEAVELREIARIIGVAEGHKLVSQAESMEVLAANYGYLAFDGAVAFDGMVKESSAPKEGKISPVVITLGVKGNVTVSGLRNDREGAEEYRRLVASANRGAISECGLAFAIVYSDGYAKVCRVIDPVARPLVAPLEFDPEVDSVG